MNRSQKRLQSLNKILNVYSVIGVTLWILATVLIFTPALPYIWYTINPNAVEQETDAIVQPTKADPEASFDNEINPKSSSKDELELPPLDSSLIKTNTLVISKIGVNAQIHEAKVAENALKKGVWRVYDYGTPEDNIPIILASHRFGYLHWSRDFRNKNSFYNLPKTKVGDSIRIIWNQRRYEYEIYKSQEGTEITDYDADLILYTCKMFNSPVRIFKYAKRVN